MVIICVCSRNNSAETSGHSFDLSHFCENVQLKHFLCVGRYKQKIKYASAFGDDLSWLSHVLRIGGHNVSTLNLPLNSFPGNRVNSVLWK